MIEFSIPDFWQQCYLNSNFILFMEKYPEFFNEDIKVTSIFGSFPCIWNGGRGIFGTFNEILATDIISFFNSHNISIRYTFTNQFLKETDKYDYISNLICEITEKIGKQYNIQNACNIYDMQLKDYIKKTYPSLQIIYSTTKEIKTIEEINKYSENNLLIPSYTINHNIELLKQLKYPENIELLCIEDGCVPNCPKRKEHQQFLSALMLEKKDDIDIYEKQFTANNKCHYNQTFPKNWYIFSTGLGTQINAEKINNTYIPLKLNKFKISGRGVLNYNIINNIESYVYYFVKPESKNFVRNELLMRTFGTYPPNIDFVAKLADYSIFNY